MTGEALQKKRSQTPLSIGLMGMRERVYALEGTLEINGVKGKGTTVTVIIPLHEDKKRIAQQESAARRRRRQGGMSDASCCYCR